MQQLFFLDTIKIYIDQGLGFNTTCLYSDEPEIHYVIIK